MSNVADDECNAVACLDACVCALKSVYAQFYKKSIVHIFFRINGVKTWHRCMHWRIYQYAEYDMGVRHDRLIRSQSRVQRRW